jgi:serine/threonine protein phosphatase PrpC
VTVLRGGAASDVGRVRHINQDLALTTDNLFAVADGMGGHAGGEVAAQIAIDALRQSFARHATTEGLSEAFSEANVEVWRQSQAQSDLRGMGTTLTAAALVSGSDGRDVVALANVGDSRAYLYSTGRLTQVTADHSLAEEKVRQGEMTEAQAAVHPQRHILTRALGIAPEVAVDVWELHVRSGDRILLCSDGLTNEVGVNELTAVLGKVVDPEEAAASLVRTANEHGGNDNITVVVIDVLVGEEGGSATVIAPVGAAGIAAVVVAADAVEAGTPADAATVVPGGAPDGPGTPAPPVESGDETAFLPALGATGVLAATGVEAVTAASPAVAPPATAPHGGDTAGAGSEDLFIGGSRAGQPKSARPEPAAAPEGAAAATAVTSGGSAGAVGTLAPPRPPAVARPETRSARRRRLGVPRAITLRVVGFFLLLVALVAGTYAALRWYNGENWYVTLDQNQIVIYQGQPGGLLWFKPKLVEHTGVTTAQILAVNIPDLQSKVSESSLAAAKHYVSNLLSEYRAQQAASTTTVPSGIGPSGNLPTLPPPPTSTTTTTPHVGSTVPTVPTATTLSPTPTTHPVTPTTHPVTPTTVAAAPPA